MPLLLSYTGMQAEGHLARVLQDAWREDLPMLDCLQSDLVAGQADGIVSIDNDALPKCPNLLELLGTFNAALARMCFYAQGPTFLTVHAMCALLKNDGIMVIGAPIPQMGCVAQVLLSVVDAGVLCNLEITPAQLDPTNKKVTCHIISAHCTSEDYQCMDEMKFYNLPKMFSTGSSGALAQASATTMRCSLMH